MSDIPYCTIAYDVELMQPGCVLLQAAFGATIMTGDLVEMTERWLLVPTDNMKVYKIRSKDQLDQLIKKTNGEVCKISETSSAKHKPASRRNRSSTSGPRATCKPRRS